MSQLLSVLATALEKVQILFRAIPLPSNVKGYLRDFAYSRLECIGSGNAGYEEWKQLKVDRAKLAEAEVAVPIHALNEVEEVVRSRLRPAFLFVTHRGGGGTEVHVQQLAGQLEQEGVSVYFLRPTKGEIAEFTDRRQELKCYVNLVRDRSAIMALLRSAGIAHIHVHNLLGWPMEAGELIQAIAAELLVEYDFTVHDYLCFCPRFNLFDPGVQGYCGEPAPVRCNSCIHTYGSPFGRDIDIGSWRSEYDRFLSSARRVFVPTKDVGDRVLRYFPRLDPIVRPHPEVQSRLPNPRPGPDRRRRRSVMVLGDLRAHKGSRVLLDCARDAAQRNLPLSFTVVGNSDLNMRLRRTRRVSVLGKYERDDLDRLLKDGTYDLAFIPAVWPETYSYTLSEVWRAGLYPVAFDIGAVGERISRSGVGTLLPYDLAKDPAAINEVLLAVEPRPFRQDALDFVRYGSLLGEYYDLHEL